MFHGESASAMEMLSIATVVARMTFGDMLQSIRLGSYGCRDIAYM